MNENWTQSMSSAYWLVNKAKVELDEGIELMHSAWVTKVSRQIAQDGYAVDTGVYNSLSTRMYIRRLRKLGFKVRLGKAKRSLGDYINGIRPYIFIAITLPQ